jgi:beta-lactam-binding protein with PASTA domain
VISHLPAAGSEVKENRKIYLTVNPSGYRKVTVPNLIQITKRNAESTLKAIGFQIGEYSYQDDLGKDMVLEIRYNGKKIVPGILLPKTSKIDLVLGNGKR